MSDIPPPTDAEEAGWLIESVILNQVCMHEEQLASPRLSRPLRGFLKVLWLTIWVLLWSEIAASGMVPDWMLVAAFLAPMPVVAMVR